MTYQTKNRLDFIDFAKGFAISTIVLMHLLMGFHLPEIAGKMILIGGTGVRLR